MKKIEVTQNDYSYKLTFNLEDSSGSSIDLTDLDTAVIKVQKIGSDSLKFEGDMDIEDASGGEVSYTVQDGDFDEAGEYYGEIELTYIGGSVETYDKFVIYAHPELPR